MTPAQGLLRVSAITLVIQGFGSPLTEALCNTPLGLTTLTHHLTLPWWTPLLAGWAGTTLLLISLRPRAGDPRHVRGGEGELDLDRVA
ncbi:hypothetical protein [Streptomyces katsurahamanus]|uniref:MFS transporter n=1 Tax=Streptomyces katsurahamanus TaxID=2577098 RepID=A0ABW9P1H7_9ACTN|nr:hypothetical protein [Streptomyces katsurahamanus]MQS39440.1 hypothetical protein [Streptomyces katsurahamanus]